MDEEQQRLYIASPTKQKHEPGEIAVPWAVWGLVLGLRVERWFRVQGSGLRVLGFRV